MKKSLALVALALVLSNISFYYASAQEKLSGQISISGAWALYPMVIKWSEEFRKLHPGVRIDVSAGGAGKGLADALNGMVEIDRLK